VLKHKIHAFGDFLMLLILTKFFLVSKKYVARTRKLSC